MRVNSSLAVWINGKYVPESRAAVPVFDSAYLYGIGLFETLRIAEGEPRFWREHFRRFQNNARRTGLRLPLSASAFYGTLKALAKRNRLRDATVRLMLSETEKGKPSLVITARPYAPYAARCYASGARVIYSRIMSADSKTLSAIKTTSYLSKMLPRREAARRGADEALLVTEDGRVTEGASSSLFLVRKGFLITPPLTDGLLPGTRRKAVLMLAKKLRIPVRQKSLRKADLARADEIFITSSLKDVMPVGWVERRKIGKSCPGPVTRRLQEAYSDSYLHRLSAVRSLV